MATRTSCREMASFGKRFVTRFFTQNSTPSISTPVLRRSMHTSVYDKNLDDHVRPVVVPDDIIQPESENYWAPNPHTGVFGPASDPYPSKGGEFNSSPADGGAESVLEQKAFFRPLEDLDKPQHA